MMKLPPKAVVSAGADYNDGVRRKCDRFGKSPRELRHLIVEPPFWGCYAAMTIHYTMGGLKNLSLRPRCSMMQTRSFLDFMRPERLRAEFTALIEWEQMASMMHLYSARLREEKPPLRLIASLFEFCQCNHVVRTLQARLLRMTLVFIQVLSSFEENL